MYPFQEASSCTDSDSIYCVVVTHQPDQNLLLKNIRAIRPQVDYLHIIDNSESHLTKDAIQKESPMADEISEFRHNMGLGYALNYGAFKAKEKGFAYLLLLDQDSTPQQNMVPTLLQEFSRDEHLAAAGPFHAPNIEEIDTGFFVCKKKTGHSIKRHYQQLLKQPYDVQFLISSGSLIKLQALDKIGDFKGDFFIDHIDTEWCFRAISKGFKLKGVSSTFMAQKIGIKRIRFWFGKPKIVSIHLPIRNYYTFRNSILMSKLEHTPLSWRFKNVLRLGGFLLINLIIPDQRLLRLRMMIKGIFDGLITKQN